jgi:hypothetical protein
MSSFRCYGNSLTGDIGDLSTWTSLTYFQAGDNSLSYTTTTLPGAWDNADFLITSNGMSQTEVDAFLVDLDDASTSSTEEINISGTNAAPSSTGLTAKTSLEGKGWTVTVTDPPPGDNVTYGTDNVTYGTDQVVY